MTRGKKPVAAIDEAKKFADKMGYRWQTNEHPNLPYNLFIFKPVTAWRRLRVYPTVVGEIGWWGPDDYTNPHSR